MKNWVNFTKPNFNQLLWPGCYALQLDFSWTVETHVSTDINIYIDITVIINFKHIVIARLINIYYPAADNDGNCVSALLLSF